MSLVEQTIARLRNQGQGVAPKIQRDAPKPPAPGSKHAKSMDLGMVGLRTAGYLPEEGKERPFADHYRRIKQPLVEKALSGATALREPRIIMITSALPGDGKTFTSLNLALSMALERDISVLLVDCDVAKRHASAIVSLAEEPGLLDALADDSVDIESLVVQTNVSGLSFLPAGKRTEMTAELLSSNRMRQIMATLCARDPRRIMLLDSPPLLITNEGRTLVKIAGQVVLVVRSGQTPRQAVQDAVALFDPQQAGGLILNQVAIGREQLYYGYGTYGIAGDDA
jgi:protein-tyrosine kinase